MQRDEELERRLGEQAAHLRPGNGAEYYWQQANDLKAVLAGLEATLARRTALLEEASEMLRQLTIVDGTIAMGGAGLWLLKADAELAGLAG